MGKDILERCIQLEKKLNQRRLWANLVPVGTWENNLRDVLPKTEWNKLRKATYAHYEHRCAICGIQGKLSAHEDWEYDYENEVQRLRSMQALCFLCHMCNHLGFAGILSQQGQLDYEELIEHWIKVNGADRDAFIEHSKLAFELWDLRCQFHWLVINPVGEEISSITSAEKIISAMWSSHT